ncbi:asparagine synthase (glutamine-hydrolyzing) [Gelidibacter japonicus]|jgi:asparagine synthase (glutamine-hydrolysing)|uniref:asparagine synthase (glutamine-hydrolyzing) n=1 Tax=Gelidibacter japonicus TaxID=1962232 RepID=UPI003A919BAC
MCGIYGTTLQYSETQVKDKLARTDFRGPDQMGLETYKADSYSVTFGHNRLSIIDLDARSNQPFSYQNEIEIVFNGEIFNFQAIKDVLHKKGYTFRTTSDTEVICAAYLEYGENCVSHFNGMFAFVIFDKNKQEFFGARDRLGQKPFYYYHNGTNFEFASQVSSIQLHHKNLSISKKAIEAYLTWETIPDPLSIFNEVKKLLPGKIFRFNLKSGEFTTKTYWDIDYHGTKKFNGTYEEAKTELTSILSDAVKIRLFADVPVGVFLSGGIDSSLVTALATKASSTKVKTFSVKFNEKGFDESIYAKQVADHLQTEHNIIECNYNEGLDLIKNFHHYYDEPFADSSAIPSMLLAKHTKKQVTVALSGDAGDESFLGYHRYDWINKGSYFLKIPYPIRLILSRITHLAPHYKFKIISELMKSKNANTAYLDSAGHDFTWINSTYNSKEVDELKYLMHNNKNLLERVSDFDIKTYLNWDINTKVDRATMAYSLEARAPLMDYRVVEFARSLPTEYKFKGKNKKRILKDILYNYAPKELFDRPKAGFTMPFEKWFREDLKEYVLEELSPEGLKQIPSININKVSLKIKQHMDGSWNNYPLIWKLLVIKQWLNHNGEGYVIK